MAALFVSAMKYQLVLQWPASSIRDFDRMIEVEGALAAGLSSRHVVDGHDAGSGEVNIFIHTDDPLRAFEEAQAVLGSRDFWIDARAAYRELAKSDYIILWPRDLSGFKVA